MERSGRHPGTLLEFLSVVVIAGCAGTDSAGGSGGSDASGSSSVGAAIEQGCEEYCHLDMECAFLCSLDASQEEHGMEACVPHCVEAAVASGVDEAVLAYCLNCIGGSYPYCESDSALFPDNPNTPLNKCPPCYDKEEHFDAWYSFVLEYSDRVWTAAGGTFEGMHCPGGGHSCSFTCETCSGETTCWDSDCPPCSDQCEEACATNQCGVVLTCF